MTALTNPRLTWKTVIIYPDVWVSDTCNIGEASGQIIVVFCYVMIPERKLFPLSGL